MPIKDCEEEQGEDCWHFFFFYVIYSMWRPGKWGKQLTGLCWKVKKNLPTRTSKSNWSALHNSSFNLYFKKWENDTLTIYRGLMRRTISWQKTVTSLSPAEQKKTCLSMPSITTRISWSDESGINFLFYPSATKQISLFANMLNYSFESHMVFPRVGWMSKATDFGTNAVQYVTPQRCAVKRRYSV